MFCNKHELVKAQIGRQIRAKAKEKVCVFASWGEDCNRHQIWFTGIREDWERMVLLHLRNVQATLFFGFYCVCIQGDYAQRANSDLGCLFSNVLCWFLLWDRISHWPWPLTLGIHLSPALELQVCASMPGFFTWLLKLKFSSPGLQGKPITNTALSLAHKLQCLVKDVGTNFPSPKFWKYLFPM